MKVLACIDLSTQAQTVLENSAELAKWKKAELIIFTVAEDFIDFGEGVTLALTEQIKEQAQKRLEEAGKKVQDMGITARTVMDYGSSPADSILTFAEKEGVDLIVLGSRAKTGLDRFLIGSVASKVVAHSTCSVMVLR
ncbi:MAG TPA: universal stress protein [Fibrobacteria bacterium]|uniref:universal stress protein n=1 Tax=Fundidesulfovibrio putealis TaxID=270496 RepID=UPI00041C51D5|nr:universal stress protein [Fundidesulfovibrio putealis]HLP41184.1 universal stress protein [Fibrobacteria bacterium]